MIKIKLLSGRFKNRFRHFSGTKVVESFDPLVLGEDIDPSSLFSGFLAHQDTWEVDYFEATGEEIQLWFVPEFAARVRRALENGLPVRFMDHEWRWNSDGQSLVALLQEIEDVVSDSGFVISIESDDESGLVISTHGFE